MKQENPKETRKCLRCNLELQPDEREFCLICQCEAVFADLDEEAERKSNERD